MRSSLIVFPFFDQRALDMMLGTTIGLVLALVWHVVANLPR